MAHTHAAFELYSTPRLIIDSSMPGSGKTTVIEHLYRLGHKPVQAASLSSPALMSRMLSKGIRTILIDEADRSLDPKRPGVEEFIAIINSGYKRGATRPVLVPSKGGEWEVSEMPTFAPVAMAGNSPHLPDDTRSRSIRLLLMPDLDGTVESSDWEELEPDAADLAEALSQAIDEVRDTLRTIRPVMPADCVGRSKERWAPLMRVAALAGGRWPTTTVDLIERDLREIQQEREDGLANVPPAVTVLRDLADVWPTAEEFTRSTDLVERLVQHNPEKWSELSGFGKRLTVQRLGRMLSQSFKVFSTKNSTGARGYTRSDLDKPWRQFKVTPEVESPAPSEPSEPSKIGPRTPGVKPPEPPEPSEPSNSCWVCGAPTTGSLCDANDAAHAEARGGTA
ncbi:DUF3631 domain-containing protein [Curtobacterium sp. AB451]|uniref:DUF3631 domain-containing protein n=1 Tax=Curtobacterium sp. AB451 TaxID=3422306 RepID=UPI003D32A5F2